VEKWKTLQSSLRTKKTEQHLPSTYQRQRFQNYVTETQTKSQARAEHDAPACHFGGTEGSLKKALDES
jgi:hypothetical protein